MLTIARILALIIFLGMFTFLIIGKAPRHIVTLVSGALVLLLVFGVCLHSGHAVWSSLNLESIVHPAMWYGSSEEEAFGISWSTILFILGVWFMVESLSRSGFFKWICLALAKGVKYKIMPLFLVFMLIAAFLSMFIDSITVILFLAAITIELSRLMKFDPVSMILAEVFCANLGGSATMSGDPPNVIIGSAFKFTFFDFLSNTGIIAAIVLVPTVIFFMLINRKKFKAAEAKLPDDVTFPAPMDAITHWAAFIYSAVMFLAVVVLLVTNKITGLTITTIGLGVGILSWIGVSVILGGKTWKDILKAIDYKTIGFFVGLFLVVSGLEFTGCLNLVARFIERISGGNPFITIAIVLWISAIVSAFVDNIPFAATMVPVVKALASPVVPLPVLAFTLSIGTDIGGNATPIGASANVVATSISAQDGHPINWGRFCKYNAPATIVVIALSMVLIFAKYYWLA